MARGMFMMNSAIVSRTATMNPNTVVTTGYWRVPWAKLFSAAATVGRSAATRPPTGSAPATR